MLWCSARQVAFVENKNTEARSHQWSVRQVLTRHFVARTCLPWVISRHFGSAIAMSALPPKADICGCRWNVRFVPIADIPLVIRADAIFIEKVGRKFQA